MEGRGRSVEGRGRPWKPVEGSSTRRSCSKAACHSAQLMRPSPLASIARKRAAAPYTSEEAPRTWPWRRTGQAALGMALDTALNAAPDATAGATLGAALGAALDTAEKRGVAT